MLTHLMRRLLLAASFLPSVSILAITRPGAAAASFTIDDPAVTKGVGEQVIEAYYPQLAGQGPQIESSLNTALGGYAGQLAAVVNQRLNLLQFEDFLAAMADSGAAEGRANGVDYASDAAIFSLSASGGVGVKGLTANHSFSQLRSLSNQVPAVGLAVGGSVSLGLNLRAFHLPTLGPIDPARVKLTLHYAGVNLDAYSGAFSYHTFGLHGRYQLVDEATFLPGGMLRWGGLTLGGGVNYTDFAVAFATALPSAAQTQNFTYQNRTLKMDLKWQGTARLGADINVVTIPFEVATSMQLLYILTLYGGAAADLNFGSATMTVRSQEPVKVNLRDGNEAAGAGLPIAILTPNLKFNATAGPHLGDLRAFFGAQINLFVVALFGQVSADTTRTFTGNLGLRIFW